MKLNSLCEVFAGKKAIFEKLSRKVTIIELQSPVLAEAAKTLVKEALVAIERTDKAIASGKAETTQAVLYDEVITYLLRLELLVMRNQMMDYVDELVEHNQQITVEIGQLGGSTELGLQIEDDLLKLLQGLEDQEET